MGREAVAYAVVTGLRSQAGRARAKSWEMATVWCLASGKFKDDGGDARDMLAV